MMILSLHWKISLINTEKKLLPMLWVFVKSFLKHIWGCSKLKEIAMMKIMSLVLLLMVFSLLLEEFLTPFLEDFLNYILSLKLFLNKHFTQVSQMKVKQVQMKVWVASLSSCITSNKSHQECGDSSVTLLTLIYRIKESLMSSLPKHQCHWSITWLKVHRNSKMLTSRDKAHLYKWSSASLSKFSKMEQSSTMKSNRWMESLL